MGRLTLRQFYLLLAEYYDQQRVWDGRFYEFVRTQYKQRPDPGVIFPLLARSSPNETEHELDIDDDLTFQTVAASLTSYQ